MDSGARECENIIRKEFNLLRKLLNNREEYIIADLHQNKDKRIEQLNAIDIDIETALQACHKSKYKVECIVENDTLYSGASWAVLTARKSRARAGAREPGTTRATRRSSIRQHKQ